MTPEMVRQDFITAYPSVSDLRDKAKRRIPRFAFEYLDGGCNDDVNLRKNSEEIQQVELTPYYLREHQSSELVHSLFGQEYSAPFGVAPIGLQGLIWPGSAEILARASVRHNIPFVLSTVTTCSIERAAEITEGRFWFQLYHPAESKVRDDVIKRAEDVDCQVLVALSDVPTFGFRPRDIRNGLAMPPKMNLKNFVQMIGCPNWVLNTLRCGTPRFESLIPYMPSNLNLAQLGKFMNQTFEGRLNVERLKAIRDLWPRKLVVKGIVSEEDAEDCAKIGVDGIIVSNHGGRQLDAGESTIKSLSKLVEKFQDRMTIMMDSGIRNGPDVARTLAAGADFVFLGRSFMYGVAALGNRGGNHTIAMLKLELQQILEQLCCRCVGDLPKHLIESSKP